MRDEKESGHIAYFSMEFALNDQFRNYAGGLGVLAADTLFSFADMDTPAVGVTLWYHNDDDMNKALDPSSFMQRRPETIDVQIEDRRVNIAIWEYTLRGARGARVPILFLSAYLPENERWDRDLTKHLYASDRYTRLGQETILGVGGYRALNACGYTNVRYYHMNEGHTALIGLERLRTSNNDADAVRARSTFTTHTPIPAGHDYFDYELVQKTLGGLLPPSIRDIASHDQLGMTELAMNLSVRTNAVSRTHRDVTNRMFPGKTIEYVTNGIYHPRWVGSSYEKVYDTHLKGWREDPGMFARATSIPDRALSAARKKQKKQLIDWINEQQRCFCKGEAEDDDRFDEKTLTIGFARRFVPYKRPSLIFKNLDRLRSIGHKKVQFVFAGRCHPDDSYCNQLRESIIHYDCELRGQIRVVVIPDYNLTIARRLVAGVDLWLNNPTPPREASGTSGMKAALNGALNLSILDGWWVEGYEMYPQAGWGVMGVPGEGDEHDTRDNEALLAALEEAIECYYGRPKEWRERMKHAIALLSYFNTFRMIREYEERMWL